MLYFGTMQNLHRGTARYFELISHCFSFYSCFLTLQIACQNFVSKKNSRNYNSKITYICSVLRLFIVAEISYLKKILYMKTQQFTTKLNSYSPPVIRRACPAESGRMLRDLPKAGRSATGEVTLAICKIPLVTTKTQQIIFPSLESLSRCSGRLGVG